MSQHWSIKPDWAQLETGSPEEQAGFSALSITAYGACLTSGHDRLLHSVREAPFLSSYHLAEWLAWNWWRLRWEPRKSSTEWELSHAMASIGNGYIWPNIHFLPDGQSIALVAKPSPERERTPYRYISDEVKSIPASEFESEVDLFIDAVLQRLDYRGLATSNLADIWRTVWEERQDATLSQQRKVEALLGEDPGELNEAALHHLLNAASLTGHAALEEIAANRAPGQGLPDVSSLVERARRDGISSNVGDRISLNSFAVTSEQVIPAWKAGAQAAQALRVHQRLAQDKPISSDSLSGFYGAPASLLDSPAPSPSLDLSFSLNENSDQSRVLLRAKWKTGRRFELARLLGDHILYGANDPMNPATRSSTYRQKAQRAFAAELLSPFKAVDEMLGGDYSMESQQDVAHHFEVSDLTVRTLLVNHNRIERGELDEGY